MRELTIKQKETILEWMDENLDKIHLGFDIRDDEILDVLENQNNYETLTQDVNRFISDTISERIFGRRYIER